MDLPRAFLAANALLWLPYGLFCLAQPDFLAEAAGVTTVSSTGTTELRAMYGGLQTALGSLALLATFRRELERTALVALAFLAAGLFTARFFGSFVDGGLSTYTIGALLLESTLAILSIGILRRRPSVD